MSIDQAFAGMPLGPLTAAPSAATRPSGGREEKGDSFLREGWSAPPRPPAPEPTSASRPALHMGGGGGVGVGGGGVVGPPQGPARGASVCSASVCSEGRCESVTIDIPPAADDEVTCSTTRPLPCRAFQPGHSRPYGER